MKIKFSHPLAAVLLLAMITWSCSDVMEQEIVAPEAEVSDPTYEQAVSLWQELDLEAGNPYALRLNTEYNYFEIFENQLFFVPGEGYQGGPAPGFYPGTGKGLATRMGKAKSFLNQFAFVENGELTTVGAPVTLFFGDELAALGLDEIPDQVSSITVDKKGDALYVKNIKNTVTPISASLSAFIAEVEFIGGTGQFAKFKGTGVVRGNFNPMTGAGASVTFGNLKNKK
ncbi:hypothetical protein [Algoriphagus litoralis]|uniref:hypothetical protein n=1 Tax=Algoriphagus litoralis TaxID=2202829 RepID=UPI000DBABAA4|nr:hypothetical protein [Algoriphagus litoralis]